MFDFIKKIIGTKNEREVKRIRPIVEKIAFPEPYGERLTYCPILLRIAFSIGVL